MSGAQTSTFGNVLFNAPAAYQAAQQYQDNQLLMQQHQQQIGAADTEMAARIAGSLLTLPDEQARAAAYPTMLAQARANNYRLPHAPETYPGEAAIRATAQMGTPSKDLYAQGIDRTAKGAIAPGDGSTTATGTGGGGTNAPPGTSTPTKPLNLADIHPDLTQFSLPSGVGLTVAKSAAPQFQGLLTDLEAAGYKLDPNTTGGYNPRNIAGTNTPSQHAHGLAIDVNWQRNQRGANTQADIPPDLARKLAAKWGLTWGGDWQGADRDPMHFEVARGSGSGTDHPSGVATGWNANNPLNLTTDTGGVVTPGGARLASFGSMADGVAATAAKLQSYQTERGLDTVRKIYTEWHKGSPVNEADMQRIAGAIGVGVDQPFQLDPTKTAAWITAAQPGETGTAGKRLSPADIAAGVRQASAGSGPGGATAAATPPGVQMGGAPPPPPGGAPGAYGGGGMGAAIGRPAAVSGTSMPAGRPTGPPVITDQPAGSNVVAGPPGVATVGAPQPPSPEVPGNVAAINAGIVARGGQPVTDPNATPTPARYAGTAPAPSVEAPPETGWGSQVGSGYGPQNTLAPPPPPPAPARPAVPATTAQPPAVTQPPAADTLPPLPAPTPPERRNNNGLTDAQQHDINTQRNTSISAKDLQAKVDAYRTANDARAEKFQADQMAYLRELRERQTTAGAAQHQTLEEQRQAAADAALAEQRRIENQRQQESAARDAQRLAIEQKKAEQGTTQDDRDFYNLRTEDPSSQKYADSYVNQKWKIAPNGNVIEQDMSRYPAPNRNIQRPTFLPAPTPQGLDEVRKADTDAKVITSAIDHYVDVFSATGGGSWDAYFANPRDPKTQQLLGAFDRMKTVLRSPVYYNTGVLQPAEMELLKQDLVTPQSLRGVFATPEALATRMGEIKLAILTRQDAELRSIGRDGVIVRDKADFAKVPIGGRYYDEDGHLHVRER